ncbi:hypothetical protein S245_063891, partial [Arachis hypogaea]
LELPWEVVGRSLRPVSRIQQRPCLRYHDHHLDLSPRRLQCRPSSVSLSRHQSARAAPSFGLAARRTDQDPVGLQSGSLLPDPEFAAFLLLHLQRGQISHFPYYTHLNGI